MSYVKRRIDSTELTEEQIEELEDDCPIDTALSRSTDDVTDRIAREVEEIKEAAKITGEDLQMRFGPACGGNDWSAMYR